MPKTSSSKKSGSIATLTEARGTPIPATLVSRLDGSFALTVKRNGKAVRAEVGPGFAHILQLSENRFRETFSCPASTSAAHLVSEIVGEKGMVKRRCRAVFARGTVRHDIVELGAAASIARRTRWIFPDGSSAQAEYGPQGRTLEYLDANGASTARFNTRVTMNPTGLPASPKSRARARSSSDHRRSTQGPVRP